MREGEFKELIERTEWFLPDPMDGSVEDGTAGAVRDVPCGYAPVKDFKQFVKALMYHVEMKHNDTESVIQFYNDLAFRRFQGKLESK